MIRLTVCSKVLVASLLLLGSACRRTCASEKQLPPGISVGAVNKMVVSRGVLYLWQDTVPNVISRVEGDRLVEVHRVEGRALLADLAADDDYVYWSTALNTTRLSTDGSQLEVEIPGGGYIALHGDRMARTFPHLQLSDRAGKVLFDYGDVTPLAPISLDDDFVYWYEEGGRLVRMMLTTGRIEDAASAPDPDRLRFWPTLQVTLKHAGLRYWVTDGVLYKERL